MDIELSSGRGNGYSSGGFGSTNSNMPSRLRLSQPCDEAVDSSAASPLVRELQQRINDLQTRIEGLEDRLLPSDHAVSAFNTNVEAEPSHSEQEAGGTRLNDLPRGPLTIEVVAAALGKSVRTLRGWCQVEKYEIPTHKEAGYWRFYRDELVAWYADYEAISRRDAKRAQAKRRKTKHGNQGV